MKVLFIKARKKSDIGINKIDFSMLPKKLFIAYSIQYKELAEHIKRKLRGKVQGCRQVLGCSKLKSKVPILLIGSGKFHALQLALQNNVVYILEGNKINKLAGKEIEKLKGKRKAALSKFYAADKVGILVSTKPGQENLQTARILKKKLEKKGKEATIFLADNINIDELENYNIESWVNTACPALAPDSRIINFDDFDEIT